MPSPKKFDQGAVQKALQDANIDGWLFYDFRGSDPIAADILGLNPTKKGTRRWFYYVPASGQPTKLLHAIEKRALEILPGEDRVYLTWESLRDHLREILSGAKTVAMQYSPGNEVPYVSKVDAGTVESVRAAGVDVVTSADLVQLFNAVLTDEQFDGHQRTAELLYSLIEDVFGWVGDAIRSGNPLTERQVVDQMEERLSGHEIDHSPIVGVNEHAADPHFEVPQENTSKIQEGDLLLVDVWARENKPGAIYADITWCAYAGATIPEEINKVFDIVARARDAAIERADEAFRKGDELRGFELDRVTRAVIEEAGYGEYFIHRTGHSIHESTHGNGANLDDLETHDTRKLLPGTLFSVEPGIYLPGRFGIRSEVDVFHTGSGARVTGKERQRELVRML